MAERTLKSPASKPAPKPAQKPAAAPRAAAVAVPGVTRLKAWPDKEAKNKPAMSEEEAAAKSAQSLAEQQAEAARQAAADAGSSAPHPHAPGYEAPRLDAEGNPIVPEAATTADVESAAPRNEDGEPNPPA